MALNMMVVSSYDLSAPSAEDPPARAGERHRPGNHSSSYERHYICF